MAMLMVHNLPDEVRHRLERRAIEAGNSLEEQVRLILLRACVDEPAPVPARMLPDWVDSLYGPNKPTGVVNDFLGERTEADRRESGS